MGMDGNLIIIKDFPQMLPHRLPFIFHWPGLGHVAAHTCKRTWGINNNNKCIKKQKHQANIKGGDSFVKTLLGVMIFLAMSALS